MKKLTLFLTAFCMALSGCVSGTDSPGASSESATEASSAAEVSQAPETTEPEEEKDMYGRSLLNEGDSSRVAAAMKKAESGGPVTVGVIGGSITQGTNVSGYDKCYASLLNDWWVKTFPESEINFINAGIGGTNSYLGVHRADEQLLDFAPDFVIVEFSVNDTDKVMNKYSYDSLVRKILNSQNSPGVVLLFMTMEDGTSLQDSHKEVGFAYNLPMISYHDAVMSAVDSGELIWSDISGDDIHPNDAGHEIINALLTEYLDGIKENLGSAPAPVPFDVPALTKDYYKSAALYNAEKIEPVSMEGFEVKNNSLYRQFPSNWVSESGGNIVFEAEGQAIGIFFMRTVNGKSGNYEVYVDGEYKDLLEGDFTGGWGSYGAAEQILISSEPAKHTIEIKPAAGFEDKGITILAVMIS